MSRLSELVSILTGPHLQGGYSPDGGMIVGTEEGLLLQLEEAVASSGSGTGGGSNERAGLPINLGALDLFMYIVKEINSHVPLFYRKSSVSARVQHWEGQVQNYEAEAEHMERKLEQFVDQIRECLNPEPRRPLPNVACPECLMRYLPRILDGETVLLPVITVWPKRLVAECQQCEAHWEGTSGLMRLGLHQESDSG